MLSLIPVFLSLIGRCLAYEAKELEPRECVGQTLEVAKTGLMVTFTGKAEGFSEGQECIFNVRNPQPDQYKQMSLLVEQLTIPGDCSKGTDFLKVIGSVGGVSNLCGQWEVHYEADIKSDKFFDRTKQTTFTSANEMFKIIVQTKTTFENFHAVLIFTPYNEGRTCGENQFNCKLNSTPYCIHEDLQCNGHFDCGSLMPALDESQCGLSAGAIAGIVLGVLAAFVIICGILYYFFVKK